MKNEIAYDLLEHDFSLVILKYFFMYFKVTVQEIEHIAAKENRYIVDYKSFNKVSNEMLELAKELGYRDLTISCGYFYFSKNDIKYITNAHDFPNIKIVDKNES